MIVFVPGYDPATNANLAVARELVSAQDLGLLAGQATRANLVEALRTRPAVTGRPRRCSRCRTAARITSARKAVTLR